jgi:hypothetical protein
MAINVDAWKVLPTAVRRPHPVRAADDGLEVIGHLRPFGEPPSEEICSRYYDSDGNTLDYVYELSGDTLTIWAGGKGSPAHYRGEFSTDGQTVTGEWVYPGGGGYGSTMSRS